MPLTLDGLEIGDTIIGKGSHSKVLLGSYYMTPVAVKEYLD
jgi:hypothetical protein